MSHATRIEDAAVIVALFVLLFTPLLPAEVSLAASGLILAGLVAMVAFRRAQRARKPRSW